MFIYFILLICFYMLFFFFLFFKIFFVFFFFFSSRRRHTRYIGDWSSHVCSSDLVKFRTQVGRLTKALVVFNIDGGILQAGIEIGKTIRLKSFATAVLDGSRCASSCAFAWLGGSPRFMQRGAQIGFHAAYINREGRPSESGVGNALVGSYLTQIGLPET